MASDVKPRNNRLLMIIGIVIAFVAAGLVILTGGGKGGGDNGPRNQEVVVSAVDIPSGQQISDSLVKVVKFAPDQVPAGALTTTKAAVGQFSAIALPKNTLITNSNLVPTVKSVPAQKKPYLDIPAGERAIAIPMGGELQAVAGYIQQDDRIDIIYSPKSGLWKTTYQNLRVARIGGPAASAATTTTNAAPALATSFVVYVNLEDAETLSLLFSTGNFKLALRSQADANKNEVQPSNGATTDSLAAKFNIPR
ncbi:MAG: Flp pilus assembly protein CpaB [Candidatus Dormibacteria bacterium]